MKITYIIYIAVMIIQLEQAVCEFFVKGINLIFYFWIGLFIFTLLFLIYSMYLIKKEKQWPNKEAEENTRIWIEQNKQRKLNYYK